MTMKPPAETRANKTDAGNGSYGICRVIGVSRSPSPDPGRSRPALVPLINVNWASIFKWRWTGEMPAQVRSSLQQLTARVHAQGRQLRFWNAPGRPEVWREMQAAGVDLIGTDDLAGLARFLLP